MRTRRVQQTFCDGCEQWFDLDSAGEILDGEVVYLKAGKRRWIFWRNPDTEKKLSFHSWQCLSDYAGRQAT